MSKRYIVFFLLLNAFWATAQQGDIRIVFTSDVHLGLKKAHFRHSTDSVTSEVVNQALAHSIQSLGKIDYLIVTGDIANREEGAQQIQPASVSWKQFLDVYEPLHIPLLLLPGNHDASNTVGYYRQLNPGRDASSITGIYNRMMKPVHLLDTAHYDYAVDKINYSRDIGGLHLLFVNMWPDSSNRIWMEDDLKKCGPQTPVLIFVHDPPQGDPKHFTDPQRRSFTQQTSFENLLPEVYNTHYERDWDEFLKKHPNIKGYFHGHENYQQFYTYKGLDSSLSLPCFRVDSPMKGEYSKKDEQLLSYQLITIHTARKQIEVQECLWNKGKNVEMGQRTLIQL